MASPIVSILMWKKKISVRQVANPGWYLRQHAANTQTLEAIREGGWDYMVMQEQSKAPSREKEWVKKNVFHPAAQLDSLRRLYAPKGKSVCYMTWGRNNDTYEGMQQQLTENHLEMADVLDAYCAPVGEAWRRVTVESVQVCSCIILMAATLVLQAVIWRLVSFMQFFLVSLLAAIIMQVYRLKRLFIYRG